MLLSLLAFSPIPDPRCSSGREDVHTHLGLGFVQDGLRAGHIAGATSVLRVRWTLWQRVKWRGRGREGATTGPVTFVHEARTAADAPGQGRLPAITQCPLLTPERSSLYRSPRSINRVAQQRSRALNSSGSTKPQQFPSGKTLERRWPVPSRSSCGDAPCPARACPPE